MANKPPKVKTSTATKVYSDAVKEIRTGGTLVQTQVGNKIKQTFETHNYDPVTGKESVTKVALPTVPAPTKKK